MADTKLIDVAPMDPNKRNSAIAGPIAEESTMQLAQANTPCFWNDEEFAAGTKIVSNGTCYECSFGNWLTIK